MSASKNNTTANAEAMEMKEVQMSTPMGITNSQSFNLELDDGSIEAPGFRMAPPLPRSFTQSHNTSHGYIPSTVVRRRSSAHVPPRRRRLLSHFRQKAKSIKVKIPRVQDVNTIDKYARLMFPLLFVCFNASYWAVYLLT